MSRSRRGSSHVVGGLLASCLLIAAPRAAAAQTCPVDVVLDDCNTYQQITLDTVNDGSAYACDDVSYPGAEVTFQVTPPAGQQVIAFVENAPADVNVDLLVEAGDCGGGAGTCVGSSISAGNTEEVSWTADGSTYFVTVDEANGFGGHAVTFSLGCPTTCALTDVAQSLSCSSDVSATTVGATSVLDYYTCGAPFSHLAQPNPESIYLFTPQQSGEVTFTLDNLSTDQDLYVLEAACDPASCIASSTDLSTNVDSVTFEAVAGTSYFIVVEAFGGPATYDLAFANGPGGGCVEDCDNAADDDADGQADCDDADCAADLVCCDDDADGFCADDCAPADAAINPAAIEACDDGVDNDCDAAIDEDCAADAPDAGPGGGDPDAGPGGGGDAPDAGEGGGGGGALDEGDDAGCGCRTGGASASSWLLVLALGALVRGRRRRR